MNLLLAQVWRMGHQGCRLLESSPVYLSQARHLPRKPVREELHQQEEQMAAQSTCVGAVTWRRAHHPIQRGI